MSEYVRTKLTVPVEIADAANRIAAVFDPDTGGGDTFGTVELSPTGELPATHYMANTLIKVEYIPVLSSYDQALAALTHLADIYGRERPDPEDVAAFCSGVIVGEPDGLMRVEQEPAA
ncbi:hypothetical protein [Alcanivorax sp.]|jgi:hypothetical protein|uniref:hypothetical protein n=1 Tax=Alcanivorax sp. TaxID=1872427 RepID=UPI0039E3C927